ncbi:GLL7 protein, partial [Dromaius novaehollandiae]|nr:GLL7 protein [Dromaius novaehollandiae]
MRFLCLLLVVLFLVLQGVTGQPFILRPLNHCTLQNGRCFPGTCPHSYYWIDLCHNRYSCCKRYVEV